MNSFLKSALIACCIILGSTLSSFSQGYKISVRVTGLKDTVCYLANHFGDKQYLRDTAKVDSKGLFVFTGKEPLEGGIYMAVLPGRRYFEFIVTEQNFSLETDTSDYVKHMKVKGSKENELFFNYLNFIGDQSKKADSIQKEFANAKSKSDSTVIREKLEVVNKEVLNYRKTVAQNNPKTFVATLFNAMTTVEPSVIQDAEERGKADAYVVDYLMKLNKEDPSKEDNEKAKAKGDSVYNAFKFNFYKAHFFDNVNFADERLVRTPIYHQKLKEYISNLTVPQVDSINKAADWLVKKSSANKEMFKYTVWYITTTHETSNLMGADAVYVHMVENYYMTKQAYWVDTATLRKITERAMLLKPLLIGKKAPQLVLADSLGKYHALHNVQAKYTIVYFWDPNCGHCQKETPKLYEVYKKYKGQGVETFAVDIDRDKKRWNEYVHKNDLKWLNVYDPDYRWSFKQLYDIYSTPVIYLLNEKKEIIAKRIGVEQVSELLDTFIKADKEKKAKEKAKGK